jgi:hypothetical protein
MPVRFRLLSPCYHMTLPFDRRLATCLWPPSVKTWKWTHRPSPRPSLRYVQYAHGTTVLLWCLYR